MMKKDLTMRSYVSPEAEIINMEIEQCFAVSEELTGVDFDDVDESELEW